MALKEKMDAGEDVKVIEKEDEGKPEDDDE